MFRRVTIIRTWRAEFLWALACFAAIQLALAVAIERWLQDVRDPEYVEKLERLQARQSETPHARLVLVLGSSRTLLGLEAGRLSESLKDENTLVFNFGLKGVGPRLQLVYLRRLLAAGVQPDWLFVEVIPVLFNHSAERTLEEDWFNGARLGRTEVRFLRPYCSQPLRLMRQWWLGRCLPCSIHHEELRDFLALDASEDGLAYPSAMGKMDDYGWQPVVSTVSPDQRQRSTELTHRQYAPSFRGFELAARPAQALYDLLKLCRARGIRVALLVPPEGSEFRALYTPAMNAGADRLLKTLSKSFEVPLIDARTWVPDSCFWDSHHLLPDGAAAFTTRFECEALRPLLQAKPSPPCELPAD